MLTITCLFLCFLFFILFHEFYYKRKNLPPGPFPLPLVGNFLSLDFGNPHKSIFKWRQEYGPIITVWFGPQPYVFFTDFPSLKEYFLGKNADTLSFRVFNFPFRFFFGESGQGILLNDGPIWREQRRFALHVLHDFGLGRQLMEPKINQQVHQLQKHLEDLIDASGQVVDVRQPVELCIANIISALMLGWTFERDGQFPKLKGFLDQLNVLMGRPDIQLLGAIPWLQHVPLFGHFGLDDLKAVKEPFWDFIDSSIRKTMDNFDPERMEQDDFISVYLKKMHDQKETGNFSLQQLRRVVAEVWTAGQGTTVTTLMWSVLFMLHYPEVQEKIHQEIDEHFQSEDVELVMSDRQLLPFTAAAIQEVQRLGNIVPINLPHTADRDLQVNGFLIPRGTTMIPSMSSLFLDPQLFPQPHKFDPTRFLDKAGNLTKIQEFIPFSLGKRSCLGKGLARMELFLIFAGLLRVFQISPVPGEPLPSLDAQHGFRREPKPFKVWLQKRNPSTLV